MTYLPDAAQHGADIFTEVTVQHLAKENNGTWHVITSASNSNEKKNEKDVLHADIVILAAGTIGSTEILMRSSEKGLSCSDMLGRRFFS